jgi:hypothetical protein
MSRDAQHTHLHLHRSHHADLFEEFCRPPSLSTSTNSHPNGANPTSPHQPNLSLPHLHSSAPYHQQSSDASNTGMVSLPGHYLPFEEIPLAPELMPLNPEDEDGVVPDMHAAFGILRALGPGQEGGTDGGVQGRGVGEESRAGVMRTEATWRDLGMEGVLEGGGSAGSGLVTGVGDAGGVMESVRPGAERGPGAVGRAGLRREGQRRGTRGLR